jgi:hypothetical protein
MLCRLSYRIQIFDNQVACDGGRGGPYGGRTATLLDLKHILSVEFDYNVDQARLVIYDVTYSNALKPIINTALVKAAGGEARLGWNWDDSTELEGRTLLALNRSCLRHAISKYQSDFGCDADMYTPERIALEGHWTNGNKRDGAVTLHWRGIVVLDRALYSEQETVSFHVTIPREILLDSVDKGISQVMWEHRGMVPEVKCAHFVKDLFCGHGLKTITLTLDEGSNEDEGTGSRLVITDYSPFAIALANGNPVCRLPEGLAYIEPTYDETALDTERSNYRTAKLRLQNRRTLSDHSQARWHHAAAFKREQPVVQTQKLAIAADIDFAYRGKSKHLSRTGVQDVLFDGKRVIICTVSVTINGIPLAQHPSRRNAWTYYTLHEALSSVNQQISVSMY